MCLVDPEMSGEEANLRELLDDERRNCLKLQNERQNLIQQSKELLLVCYSSDN